LAASGGRRGQSRRRRDPRTGIAQRLSAIGAGRSQPVGRIAQAARPGCQYPPGSRGRFPPRCRPPVGRGIAARQTPRRYAARSMFLGCGEFMPTADLALSVRKVTRAGSTRIAQTAFALAERRRKKVTAVHKANVLRVSDGLFLESVRAVASRFPGIEYEERIIDAMSALLVRDAAAFDVIVTTNMFGDILSDLAAEISGSLGLAASLNAGEAH